MNNNLIKRTINYLLIGTMFLLTNTLTGCIDEKEKSYSYYERHPEELYHDYKYCEYHPSNLMCNNIVKKYFRCQKYARVLSQSKKSNKQKSINELKKYIKINKTKQYRYYQKNVFLDIDEPIQFP